MFLNLVILRNVPEDPGSQDPSFFVSGIVVNRVRLDICNLNFQHNVFWRKPNKDICYILF